MKKTQINKNYYFCRLRYSFILFTVSSTPSAVFVYFTVHVLVYLLCTFCVSSEVHFIAFWCNFCWSSSFCCGYPSGLFSGIFYFRMPKIKGGWMDGWMDECKFPVLFLVFFQFCPECIFALFFRILCNRFFPAAAFVVWGDASAILITFSAANKAIMSLKRHYNLLLLSAIYLLFSGTDGQPKICQKF